jgi:HAD superfamily hydrolase (TIGR01484 family)
LCYATGRHFELAIDGVSQLNLPEPENYICDVGTSIYCKVNGSWLRDEGYDAVLRAKWNNHDSNSVLELLEPIRELRSQENEKQGIFKASFYGPPELPRGITQLIKEKLSARGIDADLVISTDIIDETELIDVLPPGCSKLSAIEHLKSASQFSEHQVIYAGDSGNDLEVFLSDYRSILVGNTSSAVREKVVQATKMKGAASRIFLAQGDSIEGVIQGLQHFLPVDT